MTAPGRHANLLRALVILGIGFWIFAPSLQGDWLMDDDFYLTQNALIGDPHRLWKTWFAPGSLIEYYPIEATVQAIQWQLWGHAPTIGYHFTSLVLHLLGALLVWKLFGKFGLRWAWIGGLLFAIHPAVVESVAWISELKNTLSLPPFLLAMICWIDFDEHRRPRDYFLALGWFLVAMLCKISMALFPFIILLYAWWKRGRFGWADLRGAIPFLVISLLLGFTTVRAGEWFRQAHLQSTEAQYYGGWPEHIALAGQSIAFYFTQCVWPVRMLPIYPKWPIDAASPLSYTPWLALLIAAGLLWAKRKSWGKHALLGLGFFLINLAPFIGLNSVSYMGFTWVMDHFLYLPLVGIIGLIIAALENIGGKLEAQIQRGYGAILGIVLGVLAWESHNYAAVFIGPEALWSCTIAGNPASWLAHNNLANVYLQTDRPAQAIAEYHEALRYNPNMIEAHNNLGLAFFEQGRLDDAIANYELAIKFNPHYGLAHCNLGNALVKAGRPDEAIPHYEEALRVNPNDADTRANLERLKKGNPPARE